MVLKRMDSPRIERSCTISELRAMAGMPKSTTYKSMRKGKLDAFTPGGCVRGKMVTESEALRYPHSLNERLGRDCDGR